MQLQDPEGTVVHSERGSQFGSNALLGTFKGNRPASRWSTRAYLRLAIVTCIEKPYNRNAANGASGRYRLEFEILNSRLNAKPRESTKAGAVWALSGETLNRFYGHFPRGLQLSPLEPRRGTQMGGLL